MHASGDFSLRSARASKSKVGTPKWFLSRQNPTEDLDWNEPNQSGSRFLGLCATNCGMRLGTKAKQIYGSAPSK